MNLTRQAIVTTALDIVDTYGLPDLTMRRIAANLGVQPSALYWHFSSKQALLAGLAEVILADLPRYSGRDLTRLSLWAARLHSLLLHHRNGAELVWSVLALTRWQDSIGHQVEQGLTEAGVEPGLALTAAHGLLTLVLGHAFNDDQRRQAIQLNVIPEDDLPSSAQILDDAVAIFVAGIQASLPC